MKIIVRTPNWLGDCIMALPVFRELRKKYPHAEIVAACRKNVAGCFVASKSIDRVIYAPDKRTGKREFIVSVRKLKEEKFDIGVLLTNSIGTALWMFLGGVARRIGFARDYRKIFLSDAVNITSEILAAHQGDYYLYILRVLGIEAELGYPELIISEEGKKQAEVTLQKLDLVDKKYAVIAPMSAYGGVKDWGNNNYARVARLIVNNLHVPVLITGTPEQREAIEKISDSLSGIHNMAGKAGLEGFMGILQRAALYVGGDSGGAHTAAALGVPTVSIFGITEPSRTRALGKTVAIVGEGGMCTPNLRDPEVQRLARAALDAITPDDIFAEAGALINNKR